MGPRGERPCSFESEARGHQEVLNKKTSETASGGVTDHAGLGNMTARFLSGIGIG